MVGQLHCRKGQQKLLFSSHRSIRHSPLCKICWKCRTFREDEECAKG